jgi:hypothetical protein
VALTALQTALIFMSEDVSEIHLISVWLVFERMRKVAANVKM